MSVTIEKLKAMAAKAAKAEEDGKEEERKDAPAEETPAAEDEEKPEDAPADGKPEEAPAEETPAPEAPKPEEPAGDGDKPKDEDDDEAKALAFAVNELASARAENTALRAEVARLKGALADPAFAAASLRPTPVGPAAEAAAPGADPIKAGLAACKTPEERIAFLSSHR